MNISYEKLDNMSSKIISDKTTDNYTEVYCENPDRWEFNAPHHFTVFAKTNKYEIPCKTLLTEINIQKGPIKENGINGVNNEDLLLIVMARLMAFQESEYACYENADALNHLEMALDSLRKRTNRRIKENKEGTSIV